jgi:hypothetical protein
MCGTSEDVFSIVLLPLRAPTPGTGWGCLECGLPMDGAVAVLCGRCTTFWQLDHANLTHVVDGYPREGRRVPIADLPQGKFEHLFEHE